MGKPGYFLGIQVKYSDIGIHLSQSKYIKDILVKFGFNNIKPSKTPISKKSSIYTEQGEPLASPIQYRSAVGSLQYLSITWSANLWQNHVKLIGQRSRRFSDTYLEQ